MSLETHSGTNRILFVKERMAWPRSSGHDVHTFYMMQALAESRHSVALATFDVSPAEATANGGLEAEFCFSDAIPQVNPAPVVLTKWQEKFRNYWGISHERIQWVANVAKEFHADVVVVSGLNVLPYLGALPPETTKIWYAADEWIWHHWSQLRALQKSTWHEAKDGLLKGMYERAYRPMIDRNWVVSAADAKAFRWLIGCRNNDVIPNGVDANYYAPGNETPAENSCVFWGRLDFGPNIQAVEWFCNRVWPKVRAQVPDAKFNIFGFQPGAEVLAFHGKNGVNITADLPDIRTAVRSNAVVVLPFVSGGGIKNKLLEAAAMGMPTIATPRVVAGLNGQPPIPAYRAPSEWATVLVELWQNYAKRERLGRDIRSWVVEHHTWSACADIVTDGIRMSRKPQPKAIALAVR